MQTPVNRLLLIRLPALVIPEDATIDPHVFLKKVPDLGWAIFRSSEWPSMKLA